MPDTLPSLLLEKFARAGEGHTMHWREDGVWKSDSWRACEGRIASTAQALGAMGVVPGDRVAILGPPDPRWIQCDFATLCLGGVTVGIYPTLLPEQIAWQIRHSGAKLLLVPTEADRTRLAGCAPEIRLWEFPVVETDLAAFRARALAVTPTDLCAIFYTSGTTGDPKGAMVTHAAMVATCRASREMVRLDPGDRSIVFLPLAHSLQRMTVFRSLLEDLSAYFCPSLDLFPEVVQLARPSVLASVPRMLEKIKASAEAAVAKQSPTVQRIFAWAMAAGLERGRLLEQGAAPPLTLRLRCAIADRLVFRKVRQRLGGELRLFLVGGARLDPEVARFFQALGIGVCEGWGLTETCAPATANRPEDFRFGTVGKPLPGMEIKLDADGEVLCRGPGLFSGYWQDEAATAAAFTPDGFFRTGDIGVFEDGFLKIVDRKKEILVTSGGKNIPPVNIEKKLEGGAIGQAVVIGNDRPYLVALLAPDPDVPCQDREAYAEARLREANATLAPFEQVKKYAWLPEPLTVENGMLTPTMKIKRRVVSERHRDRIEALYAL